MDDVACYGSEDKLTDCTYHTDTSEDVHDEDIWINCNPTQQPTSLTTNDQSNPTQQPSSVTNNEQSIDDTETTSKELKSDAQSNTVALAVSLVGLAISLVVIGLLICLLVYMYNRNRKSETTHHRWAGMVCAYCITKIFRELHITISNFLRKKCHECMCATNACETILIAAKNTFTVSATSQNSRKY